MIPEEELHPKATNHFAPMIDFLFIMLALFATLALSRATLLDSTVELSKVSSGTTNESKSKMSQVNISINNNGEYSWLSEFSKYPMNTIESIVQEITHQYEQGILPENKKEIEVLLHIDKNAPWDPIAKLIMSIKELDLEVKPLYEPE